MKLNEDIIVSYVKGTLDNNLSQQVEDALLDHPEWLELVMQLQEDDTLTQKSTVQLNQYFEKLLAEKTMQNEIEESTAFAPMPEEELLIAYANQELNTTTAFALEERFLKEPELFEKYAVYEEAQKTQAIATLSQKLNHHFDTALKVDEEQPVHRHLYPTLRRWLAIAAALMLFIFVGKAFYQNTQEPTYYTLGSQENEVLSTAEYQEVVNLHNLFKNKLDRLVRFNDYVGQEQKNEFIKELSELCTEDATFVVEQRDKTIAGLTLQQFISYVQNNALSDCQIVETELEESSSFLFFSRSEGFKVDAEGEVSLRETPNYQISNADTSTLSIIKVTIRC